jgi:hypothetical protein
MEAKVSVVTRGTDSTIFESLGTACNLLNKIISAAPDLCWCTPITFLKDSFVF